MVVHRFDVVLLRLDATKGREIRKTRPCLVVSPDEMNLYSQTVIVAPMTTRGRKFPTRGGGRRLIARPPLLWIELARTALPWWPSGVTPLPRAPADTNLT